MTKPDSYNDLRDEYDTLDSELQSAHQILNEYGVGKQHWSLAGRIELVINLNNAMSQTLDEIRKMLDSGELIKKENNNESQPTS